MIADIVHEYLEVAFFNLGGKFFFILKKHLINVLVSAYVIFTARDFVLFCVLDECVHQLYTGLGNDLVNFFVDVCLVLDVCVLVVKLNYVEN